MVVRALWEGLGPLCEEIRVADRPGLREAGPVVHLHTPITGRLRQGVDLLHVAQRLHPSPAVGGWPSSAARAYLEARDPEPEGLYRGLVGELRPSGDGELHVALRLAHVRPDGARLWAGAGIVEGSDPSAEWDETEWKLGVLRQTLEELLASQGAST